jgi:RNA polymerase sigma-70 factor, ECF subfamily
LGFDTLTSVKCFTSSTKCCECLSQLHRVQGILSTDPAPPLVGKLGLAGYTGICRESPFQLLGFCQMGTDHESIQLLARWRAGDEAAADEIFYRYLHRLAGLARNRLSDKMQRRIDPEDVVQSAYRSFFRHAKEDRYELKRSGDLWRLLAGITINKTLGQIEHHQAAKRAIEGEAASYDQSANSLISPIAIARDPTVEEAVALADEIESFMRTLDPVAREVLELRLQDHDSEQIAEEIQRSTRTVRRILERVKDELAKRWEQTKTK